jgi:transcriptional regulator with XRE-family HTH domain
VTTVVDSAIRRNHPANCLENLDSVNVSIMTTGRIEMGPTARTVAENLRRLRDARGVSLRALSTELKAVGRTLSADALNKIENGRPSSADVDGTKQIRRVDVDDLIALALVLNVSPSALFLPAEWNDSQVCLTPTFSVSARTAWLWAEGRAPANDWGSGAVDAHPDVDGAGDEAEERYWAERREYMSLTHPPQRQRAAEHPANAAADNLAAMVNRLVQMDQAGNKDAARKQLRVTKNRLDRLRNAIEEIELELNGQDE